MKLTKSLCIATTYGYSPCRAKIYMLSTTLVSQCCAQPQVILQTHDCNGRTEGCLVVWDVNPASIASEKFGLQGQRLTSATQMQLSVTQLSRCPVLHSMQQLDTNSLAPPQGRQLPMQWPVSKAVPAM